MRILLAVDRSSVSKASAQFLRALIFPPGSELYILHVLSLDQIDESVLGDSLSVPEQIDVVRGRLTVAGEQLLTQTAELFRDFPIALHTELREGIPGAEILAAIDQKHIDLAVLGARGHSKIEEFLMGSVSEWVLHDAPCSVMLVRPRARPKKPKSGFRLLLATDGSRDAWNAVEFLQQLDFPAPCTLAVLHVVKKMVHQTSQVITAPPHLPPQELATMAEELFGPRGRKGAELLDSTCRAFAERNFGFEKILAFGHEAEEILKAARRLRPDLIVMGSRGLTGLRRWLLGSVSDRVARHASCSVVIVRRRSWNP
ncbi:MAG: universal stress protein [Nitrospirae bacterium]|nr:MAG: universal stress protein [Nitrospirota bacterium]